MAYQVKIITFKDGRPIAVKKSYLPGVLRLNDPLESIAIRNFPLQFPGKMYLTRRSIYLQNTADCYSVLLRLAGAVHSQPSRQKL